MLSRANAAGKRVWYVRLWREGKEKYISDQLGHASIAITVDTYGHLIPGGNRQGVNRLDGVTPKGRNSEATVTETGTAAPIGALSL